MGRSRSRSRSPRRRRSRSRSKDRERIRDNRRRRDREDSRERRREREREKERNRSRSRSRDRDRDRGAGTSSGKSKQTHSAPSAAPPILTEKDFEGKTDEEIEMMKIMGISSFDTTKNKKVKGNDHGEVHVSVKRRYRQYMNRKGGFNRPLDFVQ